jgi:ATP:ADP antiporter, AAA family
MAGETAAKQDGGRSPLEWLLSLFAEVRPGEGITALLMFFNIFFTLASYYILKTVREALTIGGVKLGDIEGDEAKTYLSVIMAVLLLGIVPLYGYLGSRMSRLKLLWTTMSFIVVCLIVFLLWGRATGVGTAIGLAFFVWIGIVNYFLVAQFWAYANDIYTEAQGKRLFAIIAVGQSAGALLGPTVAEAGSDHIFLLLGVAAALFTICIALYTWVNAREHRAADEDRRAAAEKPLSKEGGFQLVFRSKYLFLIALTILVTNLVNTTGEYILSNAAKRHAQENVPASSVVPGAAASAPIDEKSLTPEQQQSLRDARGAAIGKFYGRFFRWVNLVGVLIQALLVSRIFKYLGLRVALFILPVIALGGYAAIGLLGGLLIVRIAKTAENATDYSLQNTVKQALYLPTSREAKYKAKAAIDVFFVRFGDAASAALVAIGLHVFAFGAAELALVNVLLCGVWIVICIAIAREHRRLTHEDEPAGVPGSTPAQSRA